MRSLLRRFCLAGTGIGICFMVGAAQLFMLGIAEGGEPNGKNPAGKAATANNLKLTKPRTDKETADGELLEKATHQRRVAEGFLRAEVRSGLNKALELAKRDPERAAAALALIAEKVRTADVAPKLRDELMESLTAAQRSANRQAAVQAERQLQVQQAAAEREALERINRELFLQEQKVDQLMARFNALVDAERYRDAEAIADIAEEMKPGQAGLRGAELTARMLGYAAGNNAVVDMRRKGFVDAAQQVELAHIPSSDEPPIVYADPEVWQLLTERRKKYKAVDVSQPGDNEAKIMAALDEKTELDFAEQPLTDVLDYLKQRHEIEIQLDSKALADEGLGSDVPITRNIKGITLRSALKLLLGELGLTYVIRNEVLFITSKTEALNMLTTRVYPVADLVMPIARPGAGGMGGMGSMGPGMGGMSGGGMGMGGMGMGGMGMGMGMGGGMGGMGGMMGLGPF